MHYGNCAANWIGSIRIKKFWIQAETGIKPRDSLLKVLVGNYRVVKTCSKFRDACMTMYRRAA